MYKIAVAGTGYAGLVADVCFAEVGHQVKKPAPYNSYTNLTIDHFI